METKGNKNTPVECDNEKVKMRRKNAQTARSQVTIGIAFAVIGAACMIIGKAIGSDQLETFGVFIGVTGLYMVFSSFKSI